MTTSSLPNGKGNTDNNNTEKSQLSFDGKVRKPKEENGVVVDIKETEMEDPWSLLEPKNNGKKWIDMDGSERVTYVCVMIGKVILLLGLLYFFICSLDLLSSAFRLLGGKAVGEVFANNAILSNPVSNLMIGVLATVLVQSSSTSTSIVVSMVAAEILMVQPAIFIIMGANIGTSVTNTIVSMGQAIDRNEYRRAFAGATVHDMFNWLAVLILLPIEAIVGVFARGGPLFLLTEAMINSMHLTSNANANQKFLKVITEPFTKLIIQLDKEVLNDISTGKANSSVSLIKHVCDEETFLRNVSYVEAVNVVSTTQKITKYTEVYETSEVYCEFLFEWISRPAGGGWSDAAVGVILLFVSLAVLCICLFTIVKLLHSMLQGSIASIVKKVMNYDFPGPLKYLTPYVIMLLGAGLTILVQSSSIFTSAMTPLVGIGVLSLERMYPLTLGSNIGTTVTAILAAFAADGNMLALTLQVALCHLFFNLFGIMIWYPIPFMRLPIRLAKKLGNTTAVYRWFAPLYLIMMFLILPGIVLGLSIAGWQYLVGFGVPVLVLVIAVVVINVIQEKKPKVLPTKLRNWNFLPLPFRSLDPMDSVIRKALQICKCRCSKRRAEEIMDSPDWIKTENLDMTNGTIKSITNGRL